VGAARKSILAQESNMDYTRRIIEHYITTALSAAGVCVDSDTYSELGGALEEIVTLEQRVQALEKELKDINAYLNATGRAE
jgi:hypothetical protein